MLPVGEIKRLARQTLKGKWKQAALLNVIPVLIAFIAVGGLSFGVYNFNINLFSGDPFFGGGLLSDTSVDVDSRELLVNIITIIFATGVSYTLLDMVRDPNYEIVPLRDSLQVIRKGYALPVLGMYFMRLIFIMLWALLFIVPGMIKAFSYTQSYFVYRDATESGEYLSPIDCITRSKELMDGHKGRLFLLELSFVGWHFLGAITFGLGYLFITPYLETSRAIFYEDLIRTR